MTRPINPNLPRRKPEMGGLAWMSFHPKGFNLADHSPDALAILEKYRANVVDALSRWALVILSEANYSEWPGIVEALRALNPNIIILVSVNARGVLANAAGYVAPWWPFGDAMSKFCNEYDGWLLDSRGNIAHGWPGTRLYDLSKTGVNTKYCQLMIEMYRDPGHVDGVFLDEAQEGLLDIASQAPFQMHGGSPTRRTLDEPTASAVWAAGQRRVVRIVGNVLSGGRFPVVANGSVRLQSLAGRFWQNFPYGKYPIEVCRQTMGAAEDSDWNLIRSRDRIGVIHGVTDAESVQIFASILDCFFQHDPTNSFQSTVMQTPFVSGSFGRRLEWTYQPVTDDNDVPQYQDLDGLLVAQFEHATLVFNTALQHRGYTSPEGVTSVVPPLKGRALWR